MFYHNNDYLVPILIGGTRRKRVLCREIMQSKNAKPHVFSSRFSLYDKLFFKCHLFKPDKELWLFNSLISYAENLDEYYTPALIIDGENDASFVERYKNELEKYFVVIKYDDYISENDGKEGDS